jgi:pyruvate formate lyase activating enzyme
MLVGEIIRNSNKDFPGHKAAVLYTIGCNFRCPYCHYSRFIDGAELPFTYNREQVFDYLEDWRNDLDGIVFSGGEATGHEELYSWITQARAMGYKIKLDTNGSSPEQLRQLLSENLLDYVAMDVKAPRDNYSAVCGRKVDIEAIKTSIWLIKSSAVKHEFRTTAVPGLHTVRELKSIVSWIQGGDHFVIQEFISSDTLDPQLRNRASFPRNTLERLRPYVEKRLKKYSVRIYESARQPLSLRSRRPSQKNPSEPLALFKSSNDINFVSSE